MLGHLEWGYARYLSWIPIFPDKGMTVVCFRNSNPYHNNLHAADVLQTTHWFISQAGLKVMQLVIKYLQHSVDTFSPNFAQSWLSDLEIFSLLLSAIIHDFDHSGTTNNFHIQSGSRLTYLYNDKSVLENHHVSSFFQWDKSHGIHLILK